MTDADWMILAAVIGLLIAYFSGYADGKAAARAERNRRDEHEELTY